MIMENAHLATVSLSKLAGQYGELVNSSSRFVVNSWNLLQAAHQNDHNNSSSSPSLSSSTNAFLSLPSQFLAVLANNVLTIVEANRGMTPLDYLFCLMIIVLGSISLVMLRKVTDYVFVQRILVQNGLIPLRSTNRISESLFTLIIYSTTYTLANRIVQQRQFVDHPELIWKGKRRMVFVSKFVLNFCWLQIIPWPVPFHFLFNWCTVWKYPITFTHSTPPIS